MSGKVELTRRRTILIEHIGGAVHVKREFLSQRERKLGSIVGTLVDVKRSRAKLQFGDPRPPRPSWLPPEPPRHDVFGISGEWFVPIHWLLLPGSHEPLPGQLELFA